MKSQNIILRAHGGNLHVVRVKCGTLFIVANMKKEGIVGKAVVALTPEYEEIYADEYYPCDGFNFIGVKNGDDVTVEREICCLDDDPDDGLIKEIVDEVYRYCKEFRKVADTAWEAPCDYLTRE